MSDNDWAPERIYLQRGVGHEGEHTWCADRVGEDCDEAEYVRVEALQAMEKRALAAERGCWRSGFTLDPASKEWLPKDRLMNTGHRYTDLKADEVMKKGYKLSGVVLYNEHNDRCIVELGAVRWINKEAMWRLMHPANSAEGNP